MSPSSSPCSLLTLQANPLLRDAYTTAPLFQLLILTTFVSPLFPPTTCSPMFVGSYKVHLSQHILLHSPSSLPCTRHTNLAVLQRFPSAFHKQVFSLPRARFPPPVIQSISILSSCQSWNLTFSEKPFLTFLIHLHSTQTSPLWHLLQTSLNNLGGDYLFHSS